MLKGQEQKKRSPSRIPRAQLAHQIVSRLREDVINGKWAPGETLPSHVLTAEFGVSHIPIREALLVLESEGFLSLAPNRMAIVTEPTVQDTRDKLVLLHTFETLAAELAATHATEADRDELRSVHAKLDASFDDGDLNAYHEANLQFHRCIVTAAHNRSLADFHQIVTSHLEWARVRSQIRAELLPKSPHQHREILERVLQHDAPGARSAMELHFRTFSMVLLQRVEEHSADRAAE